MTTHPRECCRISANGAEFGIDLKSALHFPALIEPYFFLRRHQRAGISRPITVYFLDIILSKNRLGQGSSVPAGFISLNLNVGELSLCGDEAVFLRGSILASSVKEDKRPFPHHTPFRYGRLMSIASDGRPVWGSDSEDSLRPHTSLPDSDDEHQRLLARQMDDAQAAAAAAAAQTGRIPPSLGPKLQPADIPRATRLEDRIPRDARGWGRFAASPVGEFADAATSLVRYRIRSLGILRQTQKDARTMFMRDLREVEHRSFPEMQLPIRILGRFLPVQLMARPNSKGPAYEELAIPDRMIEFAVSLRGIGILLKPTQEMANCIRLELARGRSKVPDYTPIHRTGCVGCAKGNNFEGTPGGCDSVAYQC